MHPKHEAHVSNLNAKLSSCDHSFRGKIYQIVGSEHSPIKNRNYEIREDLQEIFVRRTVPEFLRKIACCIDNPLQWNDPQNRNSELPIQSGDVLTQLSVDFVDPKIVRLARVPIRAKSNPNCARSCHPCTKGRKPVGSISGVDAFERNITADHCNSRYQDPHSERHEGSNSRVAPWDQLKDIHTRATPCGIHAIGRFCHD